MPRHLCNIHVERRRNAATLSVRISELVTELQAPNQLPLLALVLAQCLAFICVAHVLNEVSGIRTLCIAVSLRKLRFETKSNIRPHLSDCSITSRRLAARFVPFVLRSLKLLTDALTVNSIQRWNREGTF